MNIEKKRKKMSDSNNGSTGCGCFGCLGFIAFCMVVWMLLFGLTIDGVHHSIGCSTEHGVEVTHGDAP